jgi:hypothetical protein
MWWLVVSARVVARGLVDVRRPVPQPQFLVDWKGEALSANPDDASTAANEVSEERSESREPRASRASPAVSVRVPVP